MICWIYVLVSADIQRDPDGAFTLENPMTIDKSRRALLVFAMLAISSVALTVSPAVAKPAIRFDARTHRLVGMPVPRAPIAQPKDPVDDPFASLHLE
jgi:hypothetical protein